MISTKEVIDRAREYFVPEKVRMKRRAIRFVRKAAEEVGVPCQQISECMWRAACPEKQGFIVKLDMLAHEHFVVLVAFAGIITDRELIGRDLPIALLEFNQRFAYGSFRLDELKQGLSVVLGYLCDIRRCDGTHVSDAAREMIAEMQRSLVELYARDLIILPYYPSSQHV